MKSIIEHVYSIFFFAVLQFQYDNGTVLLEVADHCFGAFTEPGILYKRSSKYRHFQNGLDRRWASIFFVWPDVLDTRTNEEQKPGNNYSSPQREKK